MRNHTTTAARADIGRTPQLCQDALIEMLKELFAGKLFCGQEGRKALKIYKQDFPKGTNFAAVTNAQIAQAENWINNYPRKILGYKSSEIVFRECLRELGIAA